MTGPSWLLDAFAGIMIATAVYCAARLVLARVLHRPVQHDVDALHLAMGLAMGGMFVPSLNFLDNRVWEAVFALGAAWFVGRTAIALARARGRGRGLGHYVPHIIACGAMLYVYLAPSAGPSGTADSTPGMPGMSGMTAGVARFPTLGLLLALFLSGYAVLVLDRITLPLVDTAWLKESPSIPVRNTSAPADTPHRRLGTEAVLSPRGERCCHAAMAVLMAYMLVVLL